MSNSVLQSNQQDLEQLSSLFRALSDRARLQILIALAQGEKHVTAICQELGMPQPTVSHHLALLRGHNIVSHHREGKQVYYGLDGQVEVTSDQEIVLYVQNLALRISTR